MSTIEPETTKLVITMKHVYIILGGLFTSVVTLALIGWGILDFNISSVQDDIKDVRADIRGLSGTDKDTVEKSAATETSLRELIASLDKNVFAMSQNLANFTKSTNDQMQMINTSFGEMKNNWAETNDAIEAISNRLTRIEGRFDDAPLKGGDGATPDLSPAPLLPEPQ